VEIGSVYTVQVPPMTTVVGTVVASKGSCEVYFSYVQTRPSKKWGDR